MVASCHNAICPAKINVCLATGDCAASYRAMAARHHWDYFVALEEDVLKLARFIHFSEANFSTYSIELARLLMASTQEIDVLFKQICAKHGDPSTKEAGYRAFFSKGDYVKIRDIRILSHRYGLSFTPFAKWDRETPEWWTANNKVKHERHTDFQKASLGNVFNSLSALLIVNMYFAHEMGTLPKDYIQLKLLRPDNLVRGCLSDGVTASLKMP